VTWRSTFPASPASLQARADTDRDVHSARTGHMGLFMVIGTGLAVWALTGIMVFLVVLT
jgi:hypothetical protein